MSQPAREKLRSSASRVALAAGLLLGGAAQAGAEDLWSSIAPTQSAASQMRGLGALRERTILASMPGTRTPQPGISVAVAHDEAGRDAGTSDDVKSAYACLAGGTVAVAASLAVGGENITNLIAGGVVVPQNQVVLYIALVGVVFAAFCSISQSLLPIYTHHFESQERPPARPSTAGFTMREASAPMTVAPERVTFQAGILGGAATGASRRMGATAFANAERQQPGEPPRVLVAQER